MKATTEPLYLGTILDPEDWTADTYARAIVDGAVFVLEHYDIETGEPVYDWQEHTATEVNQLQLVLATYHQILANPKLGPELAALCAARLDNWGES